MVDYNVMTMAEQTTVIVLSVIMTPLCAKQDIFARNCHATVLCHVSTINFLLRKCCISM